MRVVNTNQPEMFIGCPWCKARLAYTADDVKENVISSFLTDSVYKVEKIIECCVCEHNISLEYKTIRFTPEKHA